MTCSHEYPYVVGVMKFSATTDVYIASYQTLSLCSGLVKGLTVPAYLQPQICVVTPYAQHKRGKLISVGVHIYMYMFVDQQKKLRLTHLFKLSR